MSNLTLTRKDICHHTPPCEITEWLEFTLSNYRTYHRAYHWLREVRNQKVVFSDVVKDGNGDPTGEYKFKFLCKHEYILFALRWS